MACMLMTRQLRMCEQQKMWTLPLKLLRLSSSSQYEKSLFRKVDVMGTKAVGWAPANPWVAQGFAQREVVDIASKFSAHSSRGGKDPRTSHDFEDIFYVFDNRTDIIEQISKASDNVKPFLKENLEEVLNNWAMQEAILGNLVFETREERYRRIIQSIEQIVSEI